MKKNKKVFFCEFFESAKQKPKENNMLFGFWKQKIVCEWIQTGNLQHCTHVSIMLAFKNY
jgi:hypothetical protein